MSERGAPWRGPGPTARLVVPAVLAFVAQVPSALWQATHSSRPAIAAVAVALAAAGPVLLLAARRHPGPVVAAVAAIAAASTLLDPATAAAGPASLGPWSPGPGSFGPGALGPPPFALLFAVVAAVARGAQRWALLSVATAWTVVVGAAAAGLTAWSPPRLLGATLLLLLAFGAGEFLRTRRARRVSWAREQEELRRTEEQRERMRIARELHDVLAHSLSSIAVQAGVGLHLMDSDPERSRAALAAIRSASTSALDEVRSVIGVLRADGEAPLRPAPGLDRLRELGGPAAAAGIDVHFRGTAPEGLPAPVQLAVYRIVQEALTNVVRHSGATTADVTLDDDGRALRVAVTDDGAGSSVTEPGSGLLGMRERAELLGGTISTGALPGGGFRVEAVLPHEGQNR
ncbi:MAG TPA: sensor histidine kinase [Naasia sp.]|jgi:signal transduction histidine kinase